MEFNNVIENEINKNEINYCFTYWPTSSGYQSDYSKNLLAFKNIGTHFVNGKFTEKDKNILNLYAGMFGKYVVKKLPKYAEHYLFCLVPSHKSKTNNKSAVYYMARFSKFIRNYFDKDIITRTKTIDKLASGGDRSIETQIGSLKVSKKVKGKKVVVIDDVTTTGNSLIASKQLLLKAGAKEVILFAFAKTRG